MPHSHARPTNSRISTILILLLTSCLGALGLGAVSANAETTPVDNQAITQQFDELGVAPEARTALLAKINNGETIDSESGAEPVSTNTSTVGRNSITRMVYADGSVAVMSVELPTQGSNDTGISTRSVGVSGCHAISDKDGWKRRTDCLVRWKSVTLGMGFEANYSVKSGAGRVDSVKSRKDLTYNNAPGRKVTDQSTYIGRKTSTSSMYAWGRTWIKTETAGTTKTWYLEMRVKGSAWAEQWS